LAANLAGSFGGGCLGLFRPARRCWPTWRAALACRVGRAVECGVAASFGASFPQLVAAFNNSLTGLAQLGQNLAANLAGSFGGGLSGFIQAGQTLLANLAGSFSLPGLVAQLSAALQASFGASFPELVAAFNNGLAG